MFPQQKTLLVEPPVLTYPDPATLYILDINASNESAGTVFSQMVDGEKKGSGLRQSDICSFTVELLCGKNKTSDSSLGCKPLQTVHL